MSGRYADIGFWAGFDPQQTLADGWSLHKRGSLADIIKATSSPTRISAMVPVGPSRPQIFRECDTLMASPFLPTRIFVK